MGRRKRKKVTYKKVKTLPKVFTCVNCGKKTVTVNLKYKDDKALVVCGHCGLKEVVDKNSLTEAVDAFGEFIDIYYRKEEYDRLLRKAEKLKESLQFTELANTYSLLQDVALIHKKKELEKYEETKDKEALENAEKWDEEAKKFKILEKDIRERLARGEIEDAAPEDNIYEEEEPNPFEEGEIVPSEKPKRRSNIEEVLGDTGYLEF